MKTINGYEAVIGLEVHVELKTATKIFCSCPTTFGAKPNTQCCPVCMGYPGALPTLNKKVVETAVKAGIATNCEISLKTKLDRKNYFYPDLPKAYQISQYDIPLCKNGYLEIDDEYTAEAKRIGITRIHIEEDAGKLIHDPNLGTLIDCNRCGVPLIEIVSEPDISSSEQAVAYVKKLRSIMMYADISDCRMNEGSLRCDVNLSVRKQGETKLGTRTEIKNINSFTFIKKAIDYEYERQVKAIEAGESIDRETRRFDEATGKTFSMRQKESLADYRFFAEPNIPPFYLTRDDVASLAKQIPALPDERKNRYISVYDLTSYDAQMLTSEKYVSDYFESSVKNCSSPKLLANLMITELLKYADSETENIPLSPDTFCSIINLSSDNTVNTSTAKKLIKYYCESPTESLLPLEYAQKNNMLQINDRQLLTDIIAEVVSSSPQAVSDYKSGKNAAAKALMGKVMGATKGNANPVIAEEILTETLKSL